MADRVIKLEGRGARGVRGFTGPDGIEIGGILGVPPFATDLGEFDGTTIPDDQNVKEALQALETAVEGRQLELYADIMAEPYASMIVGNDITAAVAAALTSSMAVLLPLGLNWICGQVNVGSNARIVGHGRNKTKLTRKTGASHIFFSNDAQDPYFEGFALDGAGGPTALAGGGIWLQGTSSRPTIVEVGFANWRGVFEGSPAGGGIGLVGGSGARLRDNVFFRCFDGVVSSGHTDGEDYGSTFNECQRFGGILGGGSHRWTVTNAHGDGNSTDYAGAGYAAVGSDDVSFVRPRMWGAVLGHGTQFNDCARPQLVVPNCQGNGISGCDFYDSVDGEMLGGHCRNNVIRGVEVDTTSTNTKLIGVSAHDNGDVDFSVFRSAGAEFVGCDGNIRLWDAATAASATIAAGGTGYAVGDILILVGGRYKEQARLTVTSVSGGAVTGVTSPDATDGDYWELPANPVATTGGTGTGATLNVSWDGQNSNTSAEATVTGGGDGSVLFVAQGASSGVRLQGWRGQVVDPGKAVVSASGCDEFEVPLTLLTLAASWVAYDAAWQAPAYFKDAEGWVHLTGTMKSGTTTAGTVIGTLPVGCRPAKVVGPFRVYTDAGTTAFYVSTNGQITAQGTLDATRTALDGIKFQIA